MKRASLYSLLLIVCMLAGCLPTYVGDPEKSVVDDHLLGLWHLNGDREELWFVHKLDTHRYLIQAYVFQNKEGVVTLSGSPLTTTGWLSQVNGETYLSLQTFDPKQITEPTSEPSKNRYLVVRIKLNGDSLTADGVTTDFVKKYAITTPTEFEAALTAHAGEKGTFADSELFERVDIHKSAAIDNLLDLINKDS